MSEARSDNAIPTRLFVLAAGMGALLMFWLEPLFAKMILPTFGGAPTVWIAALMFYQGVLLAGYVYAHALSRLSSTTHQVMVHGALALVALMFLPPSLGPVDAGAVVDNPLLSILTILATRVGVPMIVLAATAPLVQQWYARSPAPDAHDPYHLYAASNIGSLGALLAFPLVLEPLFSGSGQATIWSVGFVIAMVVVAGCGLWVSRMGVSRSGVSRNAYADDASPDLDIKGMDRREIAMWALLAAVPSSLLSGTTMIITTDIAALPLLWVVPLALYLATYIIAFGRRTILPAKIAQVALPIVIVPIIAWHLGYELIDTALLTLCSLAALFLASLGCHRELVRRRPDARHLTVFYIAIAAGGLLGGAFNAVAAPVLFDRILEFPIALTLAYALSEMPRLKLATERSDILAATGVAIAIPAALLIALNYLGADLDLRTVITVACVSVVALAAVPRLGVALVAALFLSAELLPEDGSLVYEERNFFGVVRVADFDDPPVRVMIHGSTIHGVQWRGREGDDPMLREMPTSYYYPDGPLGDVFRVYDDRLAGGRIGAVGAGAGTASCYSRTDQTWTFFEIDPTVISLATDPEMFSFVSRCKPDARFVAGDGRLQLANEGQQFDLLILDAFSSDSVPLHLLTVEAFETYFDKLADDGVIALHISSRFFDFRQQVGALADAHDARAYFRESYTTDETGLLQAMSRWVVLGKNDAALQALLDDPEREGAWFPLHGKQDEELRVWTDDYTSIMSPLWENLKDWSPIGSD